MQNNMIAINIIIKSSQSTFFETKVTIANIESSDDKGITSCEAPRK